MLRLSGAFLLWVFNHSERFNNHTQTLKHHNKQFDHTQTQKHLNSACQFIPKLPHSTHNESKETHNEFHHHDNFRVPNLTPSSTFTCNAFLRTSLPYDALHLYFQMLRSPLATPPNKFTFTFLLKSCLKNSASHFVKHLHCHITLCGFAPDPFLQTALVSLYVDAGHIEMARKLFDEMPHRDVVSYTALVSAYANRGLVDAARQVFDEMPERNAVSWGAVISAYSQSGRHAEALSVFRDMRRFTGMEPTEATLVSVLSSSGQVGALEEGNWVHRYIFCNRIPLTASLGTALLIMYAKCGCIIDAMNVFDEMLQRDAPAWTAMILALATHGQGERALHFFDRMLSIGFQPDHVTFIGVLNACSHCGFLDEGHYHFTRMKEIYNMEPRVEHYGCMVDILGRAGLIEEAWNLVQAMSMEHDPLVLKSLLSACSNHGYVDFAEWAFKKLIALDVRNASSYVMLANAYAFVGRWADAERVRKMMRERGVAKTPGFSLIEFDGVVHQFVAGENDVYPELRVINDMLHRMGQALVDGCHEHV